MKSFLKFLSLVGLVLTLFPSFFVFAGVIPIEAHYKFMIVGMLLWFGSAPLWMKGPSLEE